MAAAKVLAGKSLLIKCSDEGGTPIYAHPCLINTARGIVFTADTQDVRVPDCSDPELIGWLEREKISVSATINGAGVLNTTDTETFFDWVVRDTVKAVRVELNGVTGANGGGYFAGSFHCTQFEVTGDLGQKVNCSIGLVSSGAVTWTDAA